MRVEFYRYPYNCFPVLSGFMATLNHVVNPGEFTGTIDIMGSVYSASFNNSCSVLDIGTDGGNEESC
jgi:hypothetical protein